MMDNTFLNFYPDEEEEDEMNQSGMVKSIPNYVLDQINTQNETAKDVDYLGPRSSQFAFLLNEESLTDRLKKDTFVPKPYKVNYEIKNQYASSPAAK